MLFSWVLIILSAVLYAASFLFTNYFWWTSCFFLVPLFYEAFHHRLGFAKGLLWGLLIVWLHSCGILYSLMLMQDNALVTVIFYSFITFYSGLHAAVLWWIAKKCCVYLQLQFPHWHTLLQLLMWSLALWFFFLWFTLAMFWPFLRLEGFYLASPLLPLAYHAKLLAAMHLVGSSGMLFMLILWQGLLTLILTRTSIKIMVLWLLLTTAWLGMTFFEQHSQPPPTWLSRIGYIPRSITRDVCLSRAAQILSRYIRQVLAQEAAIDIIVIPEDGFQTTHLAHDHVRSLILSNMSDRPVQLLIGAYRSCGLEQFNTLYWLQPNNMISYFDKRHTMLFTEHVPSIFGFPLLASLDAGKAPLSQAHNPRPLLQLTPDVHITPYICSELFFNHQPDDKHADAIIFALCSDKWAHGAYIKNLMYLFAQLRAIEWQRDILYVAYSRAAYFNKSGQAYPLKDFSNTLQEVDNDVLDTSHCSDPVTLAAVEQLETPDLGTIFNEHSLSLLLDEQKQYSGVSFSINHPLAQKDDVIKIVLKQEKKSDKTRLLHAYLAHNFDIYYLDSMMLENSISHLAITIESTGLVRVEHPKSKQAIIASRYR